MSCLARIMGFSQSDFTSKAALLKAYRNEDYVAHYDTIHPARPLMARWPLALVGQLWQDMRQQRRLRLTAERFSYISSHLLADIGAGPYGLMDAPQDLFAGQLHAIQSQQAQAWAAMAALSHASKQQAGMTPKEESTATADPASVVRAERSQPKNRKIGHGTAPGFALPVV